MSQISDSSIEDRSTVYDSDEISLTSEYDEVKLQAVLGARAPLREEIENAIRPHKENPEKPPFTASELVVMAIMLGGAEFLTRHEILTWIIETFRHYEKLAARAWLETVDPYNYDSDGYDERSQATHVVQGFHEPFTDIDVPLIKECMVDRNEEAIVCYSAIPNEARICLAKVLEPERDGTFRFLDLPAELRNRIYNALLHFKDCDITVQNHYGKLMLALSGAACGGDRSTHQEHDYRCGDEHLSLPRQLQPLLAICSQIRTEAASIFFGGNHFRFASMEVVKTALVEFSVMNTKYLKAITLQMGSWSSHTRGKYLAEATKELTKLPKLDQITFEIVDEYWLNCKSWRDHEPAPHGYEEIPEMFGLIETLEKAKRIEVRAPSLRYSAGPSACKKFEDFVQSIIGEQMLPEKPGASGHGEE